MYGVTLALYFLVHLLCASSYDYPALYPKYPIIKTAQKKNPVKLYSEHSQNHGVAVDYIDGVLENSAKTFNAFQKNINGFRDVNRKFDVDYYFDPLLRRINTGCQSDVGGLFCSLRCGKKTAYCSNHGKCFCEYTPNNNDDVKNVQNGHVIDKQILKNKINPDSNALRTATNSEDLITQNALRHHIAHFCPTAELAKKCIYKCMKEGKPAFCGKDHNCYCGHQYSAHDKQPENKSINMYKEFKDLYAKYFKPKEDQ